jgi:hypothetical protein
MVLETRHGSCGCDCEKRGHSRVNEREFSGTNELLGTGDIDHGVNFYNAYIDHSDIYGCRGPSARVRIFGDSGRTPAEGRPRRHFEDDQRISDDSSGRARQPR